MELCRIVNSLFGIADALSADAKGIPSHLMPAAADLAMLKWPNHRSGGCLSVRRFCLIIYRINSRASLHRSQFILLCPIMSHYVPPPLSLSLSLSLSLFPCAQLIKGLCRKLSKIIPLEWILDSAVRELKRVVTALPKISRNTLQALLLRPSYA
jgi:hypothetical protein